MEDKNMCGRYLAVASLPLLVVLTVLRVYGEDPKQPLAQTKERVSAQCKDPVVQERIDSLFARLEQAETIEKATEAMRELAKLVGRQVAYDALAHKTPETIRQASLRTLQMAEDYGIEDIPVLCALLVNRCPQNAPAILTTDRSKLSEDVANEILGRKICDALGRPLAPTGTPGERVNEIRIQMMKEPREWLLQTLRSAFYEEKDCARQVVIQGCIFLLDQKAMTGDATENGQPR